MQWLIRRERLFFLFLVMCVIFFIFGWRGIPVAE